jgi:hypothetical protein
LGRIDNFIALNQRQRILGKVWFQHEGSFLMGLYEDKSVRPGEISLNKKQPTQKSHLILHHWRIFM